MEIYLKEKIGNPELFTGRKKELNYFLNWIAGIKTETSMSTAILARRKTGKTALLQRLFNLTFDNPEQGVIPFYYEITEGKKWAIHFCRDFFLTFLYQYVAFKTRKTEYLSTNITTFENAFALLQKEGFEKLHDMVEGVRSVAEEGAIELMWGVVREAPQIIAGLYDERIVQFIDEFQFLNSEIYRDEDCEKPIGDFAAGYMKTAEYKNAPLLIAGSWVGWLKHLLMSMLPSRFRHEFLENMPVKEAIKTILKYSQLLNIPIGEKMAHSIADVSEGNPFYISSLFYSGCPEKDFSNKEGLEKVLRFETLDDRGLIKSTWMEYIRSVFFSVNQQNAKNIVLHLCKHRNREVSRKELMEVFNLGMSDYELEQKLNSLVKADIIDGGSSNSEYRGVRDNIFDKVFRGVYQKDIQDFSPQEIKKEYEGFLEESEKKYQQLLGKYNRDKGLFAEVLFLIHLEFRAYQDNERFQSMISNLPPDFLFVKYQTVDSYHFSSLEGGYQIDFFALGGEGEYSLIGEVKNRIKKFSLKEAQSFYEKIMHLADRESLEKPLGFVFSSPGFTKGALEFFREKKLTWSKDKRWLEI